MAESGCGGGLEAAGSEAAEVGEVKAGGAGGGRAAVWGRAGTSVWGGRPGAGRREPKPVPVG